MEAWPAKNIEYARQKQGRPDFKSEATDRNWKHGIFGIVERLISGNWETADSVERRHYEQLEKSVTESLVKAVSSPDSAFKPIVDSMMEQNKFPRTIVSEDASGRFIAKIIQQFFHELKSTVAESNENNIAVVSYAVGRGTPPSMAAEIAKKTVDTIQQRARDQESVMYITDLVGRGESFRPFYDEFTKQVNPDRAQNNAVQNSLPTLILFSSVEPRHISEKFPRVGKDIAAIGVRVSRTPGLIPVSRHHGIDEIQTRKILIPIETREEAKVRRDMQKRVAHAMFTAYSTRNT